jgi:hypothetical protein
MQRHIKPSARAEENPCQNAAELTANVGVEWRDQALWSLIRNRTLAIAFGG